MILLILRSVKFLVTCPLARNSNTSISDMVDVSVFVNFGVGDFRHVGVRGVPQGRRLQILRPSWIRV